MNPLTAQHRREQLAVRAATLTDLVQVWPTLDVERLDETFPGWAAAVTTVVGRNRRLSSVAALRYLRRFRTAAGVPGQPPPATHRGLPNAVLLSSLGVTGPVAIKKAMSRGETVEKARTAAFVLSAGAVTRHVLDAGRETVLASLSRDDRAEGWQRVTSPRACEFCDDLNDIYPPGYGDFQSHDNCACTVEPVYRR